MRRELKEEYKREENREKIVKIKKLKKDARNEVWISSFFQLASLLGWGVIFKSLYSVVNENQYGYGIVIAIVLFCIKAMTDVEMDSADLLHDKKEEIKKLEDEILDNRTKRLNKRYAYMDYLNE